MKLGLFFLLIGIFMFYTTIRKPASSEDLSGLNFNGIIYGGILIITGIIFIFKSL
jgi:hypothetical protein